MSTKKLVVRRHMSSYVYEGLKDNEAIWYCSFPGKVEKVAVHTPQNFKVTTPGGCSRIHNGERIVYIYTGELSFPSNYNFVGYNVRERKLRWECEQKRTKLETEFKWIHRVLKQRRIYEQDRLYDHLEKLAKKDMSPIPVNKIYTSKELTAILTSWMEV